MRIDLRSRAVTTTLVAGAIVWFAVDLARFTGDEWGEDVAQHWVASRVLLDGGDPYAPGALRARGEADGLIEPGQASHHFLESHHYPPLGLVLAIPFAKLDYRNARLLWLALSTTIALLSLPLLARVAGAGKDQASYRWLAAAFLVFLPLRGALGLGQPDAVLVALLLAGLALDEEDLPWIAGAPLALAGLWKLLPLAWLLYFAARRRWRTVAATGAWAVALTLATLVVVPPSLYASFARQQGAFAGAAAGWQRYEPTNLSLTAWIFKGLAFVSSSHDLEAAAGLLARGLGGAILAVAVWAIARRGAGIGVLLVAIALVSPLTWQHHLVPLLLPLAIALRASLAGESKEGWARGFVVPFALVGLLDPRCPALRTLTAELPKVWRDAAWSVLPLAATAGIVWTGWVAWRQTARR